jgi:hypothetical protein
VNVDDESEVGRQVPADLAPVVAGIVAAHHVPVLLHEQHVGVRAVHGDAMHAVTDFSRRVGHEIGFQSAGDRAPRFASVVAPKRARGGDGGEDPRGVARIQQDGVQAHAAGARLPAGPRAVAA